MEIDSGGVNIDSGGGHICLPFLVDYDPARGRYLRASRDVAVGETILIDRAFVQAPPTKSPPVCLQCSKMFLSEDYHNCSK